MGSTNFKWEEVVKEEDSKDIIKLMVDMLESYQKILFVIDVVTKVIILEIVLRMTTENLTNLDSLDKLLMKDGSRSTLDHKSFRGKCPQQ